MEVNGAREVLKAALAWKRGWDDSYGRPKPGGPGVGPLTIALYDAVERFERGAAEDKIDHELFPEVPDDK